VAVLALSLASMSDAERSDLVMEAAKMKTQTAKPARKTTKTKMAEAERAR
jgi:hypothetical protein